MDLKTININFNQNYKGFYLDRVRDNFQTLLKIFLFGAAMTLVSLIYFIYEGVLGQFDDYLTMLIIMLVACVLVSAYAFISPLFIHRNSVLGKEINLTIEETEDDLILHYTAKKNNENKELKLRYILINKTIINLGEDEKSCFLIPMSLFTPEDLTYIQEYIKEKNVVTHELDLCPEPFEAIKSGTKSVEMRLLTPKYKDFKEYDIITFTNRDSGEKLNVRVQAVKTFKNFAKLYEAYPDKTVLGYKLGEKASPDDMQQYYSKNDLSSYRALAIEIDLM